MQWPIEESAIGHCASTFNGRTLPKIRATLHTLRTTEEPCWSIHSFDPVSGCRRHDKCVFQPKMATSKSCCPSRSCGRKTRLGFARILERPSVERVEVENQVSPLNIRGERAEQADQIRTLQSVPKNVVLWKVHFFRSW